MNLSQEEIDAMMSGNSASEPEPSDVPAPDENFILDEYKESLGEGDGGLTPVEIDTLGEVGNISMGAVATTMYTLLDRRVEITTPRVSVHLAKDVLDMYQFPLVVVEVEYTEGILGKNLLLLKETDAALITDVLMGGEGVIEEPVELSELHMSAINEIMNQMIGASATALSQVINTPVNISTPVSQRMSLESDRSGLLNEDESIIVITFDMEIESLLSSQLVQLMSYDQGRAMSAMLTSMNEQIAAEPPAAAPEPEPAPAPTPAPAPAPAAPAPPPIAAANAAQAMPVQYETFGSPAPQPSMPAGGMDLVYDIPLQVSVELGRTKKEIGDILDFDMGTIVVLDKATGDPVEIYVNGKLVASGEVVVIEENYGVRITQVHK